MSLSVESKIFSLSYLFLFMGCLDAPSKKGEIPHCPCGIIQQHIVLESEVPFELSRLQIKEIREPVLHDVQIRGIQRFHDSPLMNVGVDYEFDCLDEYIIVLNETEKFTFHIKGMMFAPVPYHSRGELKYFCELSGFYVNDSLTRYNSFFLRITKND